MRKALTSLFVAAAVCALAAFPAQSTRVQAAGAARPETGARFVPNEILIQFEDGATEGRRPTRAPASARRKKSTSAPSRSSRPASAGAAISNSR